MLAVPCSKFQVESARWHWCSKERCQDPVQKFRSYCPTIADFYPKPKNAGWKPVPSFKSRVPDGTGAVRNGAKILYRSLGAIVLQSLISIPNQKTLVGSLFQVSSRECPMALVQ